MGTLEVTTRGDLRTLRTAVDLDEVTIDTALFKFRGLMPLVARDALWAVREGGRITLVDDGPVDAAAPPYEIPFNAIRFIASRFLGRDARRVEMSDGRIALTRTTPVLAPGWSAGVVYSGSDAEIPALHAALRGLVAQPELSGDRGGEIVVCGPQRDLDFLADFPAVRYLEFENSADGRVRAAAKKNHLMRNMRGPRLAVLHSRIVLDPGALAAVPREFDILSPNTQVQQGEVRRPYLSLMQSDAMWPGRMPRSTPGTMRSAGGDPLRLHERGPVFVDGGCFYVTKPLHHVCPMADDVAWGEYEDMEWCARAFVSGFVSDIALGSTALSQTSKLKDYPDLGPLTRPAMGAVRRGREVRSAAQHHLQRLLGRR